MYWSACVHCLVALRESFASVINSLLDPTPNPDLQKVFLQNYHLIRTCRSLPLFLYPSRLGSPAEVLTTLLRRFRSGLGDEEAVSSRCVEVLNAWFHDYPADWKTHINKLFPILDSFLSVVESESSSDALAVRFLPWLKLSQSSVSENFASRDRYLER